MKSLIVAILLAGFVSVAVFGVFGMHAGMRSHDDGCVAATAQWADCPKQASPFDYLTFHLDAYRNFSLITFGKSIMNILLLVFAALGTVFFSQHFSKPPQLLSQRYRSRDFFSPPQKQKLARWLALHENSPAFP